MYHAGCKALGALSCVHVCLDVPCWARVCVCVVLDCRSQGLFDCTMYRNSVVLGVSTPAHVVARSLLVNPSPVTLHLYRAMLTVFKEAVRAVEQGAAVGCTPDDIVGEVMGRASERCGRGREWAALSAFFSPGGGGGGGAAAAVGQVALVVSGLGPEAGSGVLV